MTDVRVGLKPRQPIAIVRLPDLSEAVTLSQALLDGGVSTLEFTLTNRKALSAIEQVRAVLDDAVLVGAGTVLDADSARAAILSGAQFLVTPTFTPDVISTGRRYNVPVLCGAFTPTEILAAWTHGADLVKVFPAGQLGPGYIKDVHGPLPQIPLVPTGGIDIETCGPFLAAGAYTVAVGSSLVRQTLIEGRDWSALTQLAAQFLRACSVDGAE